MKGELKPGYAHALAMVQVIAARDGASMTADEREIVAVVLFEKLGLSGRRRLHLAEHGKVTLARGGRLVRVADRGSRKAVQR